MLLESTRRKVWRLSCLTQLCSVCCPRACHQNIIRKWAVLDYFVGIVHLCCSHYCYSFQYPISISAHNRNYQGRFLFTGRNCQNCSALLKTSRWKNETKSDEQKTRRYFHNSVYSRSLRYQKSYAMKKSRLPPLLSSPNNLCKGF
jgi:hypothetical protein